MLQYLNLSPCFQLASLSHITILPPLNLFTELLLRHVHHPFKLDPIVVLLIEEQSSLLPVARLQILKCLENPEQATSVKEVFDVFPLALS